MYAKKSYASGGMTDPKKRTISIHEQGIVDQGDGFIVYETPGGERLKVSVPDNFKLTPNKTYTAVMGEGGFKMFTPNDYSDLMKPRNVSERFGPKDAPGQRGDMFKGGGKMSYKQGGMMKFMEGGLEAQIKSKYDQGGKVPPGGYPRLGQFMTRIYQDADGEFYTYAPGEDVSFDYNAPQQEIDKMMSEKGVEKLYVPKYDDGTPKFSRDRYAQWVKNGGMDDDLFDVIEIGGRKVLMPTMQLSSYEGDPAEQSRGAKRNATFRQ